ncbi:MAG: NUDIX hydrolase [Christensenellaceae bacterium]|jgi:ADP-ribose pyrophosphatase YjhB (NUDIX family)|nr:NUDIX hydrolase [Christensenellaceae bacterium]
MEQTRNAQGQTLQQFLDAYDPLAYPHPSVTADTAVFTLLKAERELCLSVLLVRRANHPDIGRYALPGGFINMEEELHQAAARELQEETGVTGLTLRQTAAFGAPNRDLRTRVITVGFYAIAPLDTLKPRGGDDAAEASLFSVDVEKESLCAAAETYRVLLVGRQLINCRAQLRYDTLGAYAAALPKAQCGLASDHDHVLFTALVALNAQPRERAARLLTLGHPQLEGRAIRALDSALGALPRN